MNIINLRIITSSTAHSLRAISVVTFPPAFLILLITGIASRRVNPAIGILPLFFSSAYSVLLLSNERKCGCAAAGLTGTAPHMLCDLLLGVGLFICLILTWVFLPNSYNGEMIMLGTYGTNFLLCNFLVHLYFVTKQVYDAFAPGTNFTTACRQCQYASFPQISVKFGGESRNGYAPLLDGDGAPRPSSDEERREGAAGMV